MGDQQNQHIGQGEQAPDENYIERLFPKCPPKQHMARNNYKQNGRQQHHQQQQGQHHQHHQQQQQPQRQYQRRQNRTKVHQHSRRELEARRNKVKNNDTGLHDNNNNHNSINESGSSSTNNFNSFNKSIQNKKISSESSDNDTPNRAKRSNLKRSVSSGQNYGGFNQSNQQQASKSGQDNTASYGKRKNKYTASQNLLQQLNRSQSSYSMGTARAQPVITPETSNDKTPSEDKQRAHEASGQKSKINVTNEQASDIKSQRGDVTRTSRGVVFAGPINRLEPSKSDTTPNLNEPLSAIPPTTTTTSPASTTASTSSGGTSSGVSIQAVSTSPPPPPPQPKQTADLCQNKPDLYDDCKEIAQPDTPKSFDSTSPAPANDISNDNKNKLDSPPIKEELRDDDKYINLFVYDSSTKSTQPAKAAEQISPTDLNPNIVSFHHQASHQLLTADSNEDNLIRNDTSTEELCTIGDNIQHQSTTRKTNESSHDNDIQNVKQSNQELINQSVKKQTSGVRSIGTLQPVDEKAETHVEETDFSPVQGEVHVQNTDKSDLVNFADSAMQPGRSPSMKKGFVPPGFPQRIRPSSNNCIKNQPEREASQQDHTANLKQQDGPDTLSSPAQERSLEVVDSTAISEELTAKLRKANECHRVRFEQQQPVQANNTNDDFDQPAQPRAQMVAPVILKRTEHQMPSISEALFESEIEQSQQTIQGEDLNAIERNLTSAFERIALDVSTSPPCNENQTPAMQDSVVVERSLTNLRHHKLPNETSHYSVVRSNNTTNLNQVQNNGSSNSSNAPIRSSNIQFNTLSDGESGPDERPDLETTHHSSIAKSYLTSVKKRTDSTSGLPDNINSAPSIGKVDDDLMTTTKTALIFPRLDEGLSSEAESCDDEVEDDDDRAMEADVDADDDEDEDEDDDDDLDEDADSPVLPIDRVSGSIQSSTDSFLRQHQAAKTHQRLANVLQQPSGSLGHNLTTQDQIDVHKPKAAGSNYSNYTSTNDNVDHADLKSVPPYSNQNGQSNYWVSVSNHHPQQQQQQQQPMSSQSGPASQQFSNIQRNTQHATPSNGVNIPRSGASFSREDAKATNRLSSDTDNETDRLLGPQRGDPLHKLQSGSDMIGNNTPADMQPVNNLAKQNSTNSREVLIEGVLFNVKYLGSTHTDCEGRGEKEDRIHQAEMAVHEVKFRNGESQSATEVQLFISTEKIMVLDDKHRKIMMDHSLRTISYIADIGDAIVLIVRKKNASIDSTNELGRPISKISCHVFESSESHTITKSISQAFQVAYTELLKANGAGDPSAYLPKELDYQEVLNSQEMSTAELEMFARKDNQREVIVPKKEGEILGLSIVESGWGSVLPTAVIASLKQDGPAYRCKKLSVGDQILSINGISLVGLSLAECQEILKKTKTQRVARLSVVPCPITVEVKIKRPDTKYQLGFSVQNGVICSLLRGGIAERGGVRVGHRIMSINGTTVVGVPHDKIVTLLASSVGEIRMKTCLTSLYRHMLGEEKAVFL